MLAIIPPTFAAAFTITSGMVSSIVFNVSFKEKRSVSLRFEGMTWVTIFEFDRIFTRFDPTKPLDPKIKTLIIFSFSNTLIY